MAKEHRRRMTAEEFERVQETVTKSSVLLYKDGLFKRAARMAIDVALPLIKELKEERRRLRRERRKK